ncbi:MAG: hypothetical protein GY866_10180 [Proteobacteria bacterium]|nr:hypothetical protein [Pseudomonadota bacterium]
MNDNLSEKKQGGLKAALGKIGPWVVAAVIFYFVFQRVSITDVAAAFLRVDLRIFLPLLVFSLFIHFFWDSLVYTLLFRWFGVSVTYRGMLPIRGASYLLMVLNFFVGQGGLTLLMNRWKALSIKRTGSIVLFSIFTDYYMLMVLCLIGAFRLPGVDLVDFFQGTEEGDLVRFIVISWIYFALHIGFYRLYLPRGGRPFLKRSEILSTFREAPLFLYIKLGAVKLVNSIVGLFSTYFALMAFDLHVPLPYLVAFLPIVWFISSIPITVMGLGTTQAALIWLVARYAEGSGGPDEIKAAIVAYSLLWWFLYTIGNFCIGSVCVLRLPKNVWASKKVRESI